MSAQRPRVALPLLDELRRVDREARKQFPHSYLDPGLGSVGLILDGKLDQSRYEGSTPANCRTFARTGGEGVHFALVIVDGRIDDKSPVIVCIPMLAGQCYFVGENLFDFLCLGKDRGFFRLEYLGYHLDETLELYTSPGAATGEAGNVDDHGRHETLILSHLSSRLGLIRWGDAGKFFVLQERYSSLLDDPTA